MTSIFVTNQPTNEVGNGFSSKHHRASSIATHADIGVDQSERLRYSYKVGNVASSIPIEASVPPTSVFRSEVIARGYAPLQEASEPKGNVHGMVSTLSDASVYVKILDLSESMSLTMPRGMFPDDVREGQTFEFSVTRDRAGIAVPVIHMKTLEPTEDAKRVHAQLSELFERF